MLMREAISSKDSTYSRYHCRCGDHVWHDGHCVSSQARVHFGQMPAVSKVFHEQPQVQDQREDCRGFQWHSGQRILISRLRMPSLNHVRVQTRKADLGANVTARALALRRESLRARRYR
jgi:hypothetical protein